jgi:hypothetical protein
MSKTDTPEPSDISYDHPERPGLVFFPEYNLFRNHPSRLLDCLDVWLLVLSELLQN